MSDTRTTVRRCHIPVDMITASTLRNYGPGTSESPLREHTASKQNAVGCLQSKTKEILGQTDLNGDEIDLRRNRETEMSCHTVSHGARRRLRLHGVMLSHVQSVQLT